MPKRCIYRGAGPADAYLVADWMAADGVQVEIRGEALASLNGMLPAEDTWPTLWVEEAALPAARASLAGYEAAAVAAVQEAPWVCPGCGEQCEASFGSCWSCGTARPT